MVEDKTLDVILLPASSDGFLIDYHDIVRVGNKFFDDWNEKEHFSLNGINIVSFFPEMGETESVLSDISQNIQINIKEVERFMDEKLSEYYDVSLETKDKAIIGGLIAAQFFPEHILPKWAQPMKQFKPTLAKAGAVAGLLFTWNPVGILMGALMGYFAPTIGALGYAYHKKSQKWSTANAARKFRDRCLEEIGRTADIIGNREVPVRHFWMRDFYQDFFDYKESIDSIVEPNENIVTVHDPNFERFMGKIMYTMALALKDPRAGDLISANACKLYEHIVSGEYEKRLTREIEGLKQMADETHEMVDYFDRLEQDENVLAPPSLRKRWIGQVRELEEAGDLYMAAIRFKEYADPTDEDRRRAVQMFRRAAEATKGADEFKYINCLRNIYWFQRELNDPTLTETQNLLHAKIDEARSKLEHQVLDGSISHSEYLEIKQKHNL